MLVEKRRIVAVTAVLALLLVLVPVFASTSVDVTIKVTKDGSPLEGVYVEILDVNKDVVANGTTGADGTLLVQLEDGAKYTACVLYEGKIYSKSFTASENATIEIPIGYTSWFYGNWMPMLIGGGIGIVIVVALVALTGGGRGRRGSAPAILGFLTVFGIGMAATALLVQQGFLDAGTAALLGVGILAAAFIFTAIAPKLKRR